MVFVALSMISILLVLGLAIDAANLYHAQRVTQNAADAGALAGMAHYATAFRTAVTAVAPLSLSRAAEDTANAIARQNLSIYGYALSTQATFTSGSGPSADRTLQVTTEVPRNLFLLNFFPGIGSSRTVHAATTVKIKPAVVILLLDVSGSMVCPAAGDCSCLDDADPSDCGPVRKIEKLIQAVNDFTVAFDPSFDRIAVIPFRTGANLAVELQDTRGFDKDEIDNSLNSLSPLFARDALGNFSYGATNPSDAFIQAIQHLNNKAVGAPEIGQLRTSYVLFSDGAPSAGRLWFSPPQDPSLPTNPKPSLVSETPLSARASGQYPYDYYSWAIAWQDPDLNRIVGYGAQRILLAPVTGYLWNPYSSTGVAVPSGAFSPSCSVLNPSNQVFAIENCVNSFDIRLPLLGADLAQVFVPMPKAFQNFWEVYYDTTIALADHARGHNGLVYAVGLGTPGIGGVDPYQDITDVNSRKDIFLARVAKDRRSLTDPQFSNFPITSIDPRESGLALVTTNSQDLSELFGIIAKRIKLQLIQ